VAGEALASLPLIHGRYGQAWRTRPVWPHHAASLRRFAACRSGWSVRRPSSVGWEP